MTDESPMMIAEGGGIPSALRDFLFDLYDSVRTSQIPTEQHTLYTVAFRELTTKVYILGFRCCLPCYFVVRPFFSFSFSLNSTYIYSTSRRVHGHLLSLLQMNVMEIHYSLHCIMN
jgi:hypothetical protein